jgi:hypothetical protein
MSAPISNDSADKAHIENAVRTAAIAAAKGVPLSEHYLSKIVAETSDPSLTVADRVQRAATMAEQYVTAPKALNTLSASPQELAAQTTAAWQFAGSRLPGGASPRFADSASGQGKGGYGVLAGSDARALQSITPDKFAGSPFEAAGLDFRTLSYLRAQDRTFTAQNVLNAANDATRLGFSSKDRAAMFDHTTIDRYDKKARVTVNALQNYQERIEGDEELVELHDKAKHAKSPEDRKAIQAEVEARRATLAKESGLTERIEDHENHPKAKAATKRRKTAIEKKAEERYDHRAKHDGAAKLTDHKNTRAGADMFKKLTASSPK